MLKGIISRLIVGIISVFVGIVLQLPSISHAAEFLSSPHARFTGTVFPPLPPPQPQPSIEPVAGEDYVAGELFVKFKEGVKEDQKSKIHEKYSSGKIKEFMFIGVDYVKLKKDMAVDEAIKDYMADPDVEYAEPNIIYKFSSPPYDNPFYSLQWSLPNINAPASWNVTTGRSDIIIGVIDTGLDYYHEDFTYFDSILNTNIYNIWINPNPTCGDIIGIDTTVTPDCSNPNFVQDPMDNTGGSVGHGTHVAGIIGATAYNAKGVVGVNWDVKLLICKSALHTDQILTCMDYFKTQKANGNNIVAINASWGNTDHTLLSSGNRSLYYAIQAANDILFVAAAGNASLDLTCANKSHPDNDLLPEYPASYSNYFVDTSTGTEKPLLPNVISVAATDSNDQIGSDTWPFCNNAAWQSCYGRRSVDIGAPGIDILSTFPFSNGYYGVNCEPNGGQESLYCYMSGTSMAAPHVTGLSGLIASEYLNTSQNYNSVTLRNLILTGGDDITGLEDITITGKRINTYNSLNCYNRTAFSVLRISPTNNATYLYPLSPNTSTNLSVISLNCANSAGPVTVTPTGEPPFNLNEQTTVINGSTVGTGVFTGSWTPGNTLPSQLTFSSPAGSETFYAPTVVSIAPTSYATNVAQTFTTVFSDSNYAGDISGAFLVLRPDLSSLSNAILVYYDNAANNLYMADDTGTVWLGPCNPGSTNTISNTQGILNCAQTTVHSNGTDLTVNCNITPSAVLENIYLYTWDALGLNSGIVSPATVASLTPSAGSQISGVSQSFTTVFSDEDGAGDINGAYFVMREDLSSLSNAIAVYYDGIGTLYLYNDTGTGWAGSCTPGSPNTISNSQGTLNCAQTSVNSNGTDLIVNWNITPGAAFAGSKNIYLYATDVSGLNSGIIQAGTWSINSIRIASAPTVYYETLQAAYNATVNGDIIQALTATFPENLFLGNNISVSLQGGYDAGYSTKSSFSVIQGSFTISNGTVIVENIIIR